MILIDGREREVQEVLYQEDTRYGKWFSTIPHLGAILVDVVYEPTSVDKVRLKLEDIT